MSVYERIEEYKPVPGASTRITAGDLVSVNHERHGNKEGLVVGSFTDHLGRQILEVQLEAGELYQAWYPTVTRVRRTVSYTQPIRKRILERQVYW